MHADEERYTVQDACSWHALSLHDIPSQIPISQALLASCCLVDISFPMQYDCTCIVIKVCSTQLSRFSPWEQL